MNIVQCFGILVLFLSSMVYGRYLRDGSLVTLLVSVGGVILGATALFKGAFFPWG